MMLETIYYVVVEPGTRVIQKHFDEPTAQMCVDTYNRCMNGKATASVVRRVATMQPIGNGGATP